MNGIRNIGDTIEEGTFNPNEDYSRYEADEIISKLGFDIHQGGATKVIKRKPTKNLEQDKKTSLITQQQNQDKVNDHNLDRFHSLKLIKHNKSGIFWFEGKLGSMSRIIQIDAQTKEIKYSKIGAHDFKVLGTSDCGKVLITAKTGATECLVNPETGKGYDIEINGEIISDIESEKDHERRIQESQGNYSFRYDDLKYNRYDKKDIYFHNIIYLGGNRFKGQLGASTTLFTLPELQKGDISDIEERESEKHIGEPSSRILNKIANILKLK